MGHLGLHPHRIGDRAGGMVKPNFHSFFKVFVVLAGLGFAFDLLAYLISEQLWFDALGYPEVFRLQIQTRAWLWGAALLGTGSILGVNLLLAQRLKYPQPLEAAPKQVAPEKVGGGVSLGWLLGIAVSLGLLLVLLLVHYAQVAQAFWQGSTAPVTGSLGILDQFQLDAIGRSLLFLLSRPWLLGLSLGLIAVLLVWPTPVLASLAVLLSLGMGLVLGHHWTTVLAWFQATPFDRSDPLFEQDIGFYIFALPLWQLLRFWMLGVFLTAFLAVVLIYLLSGDSLSQGRFPGFSRQQQRHLYGLGAGVMLAIALSYWLSRYDLLYSQQGVVYGASYTDVTVDLPVQTGLSFLALAIAAFLFWRTLFWFRAKTHFWLGLLLGFFGGSVLILGYLLPLLVQNLVVQPNELARERLYIQRNIAQTRQAFDLDTIETQTFNPIGDLTPTRLQQNQQTIGNIRLWDTQPLLEANRQLQQIRLYYKFPDADIDRYPLITQLSQGPQGQALSVMEKRQVFVAARELDYDSVATEAKTWVNQRLVYTHGYGFTMSPVNTAGPSGLPEYFVRDIGVGLNGGTLRTSDPRIEASIPISRPRIYYGELTQNYVLIGTKVLELDYPSGDENVYNSYDGRGGVSLGSLWRRLFFATYLRDWQMLLTQNFTPQTRVLFRRQIQERVRSLAPFLRFDRDPYLVVADADASPNPSHLYWIIDAYTLSDRYPYSDPGTADFNYIRNPVKVVVDAYHGSVNFYAIDPQEPLLRTWAAIFPGLFQPFSAMPTALQQHIRYPVDLFEAQSQSLLTYHMSDPQVFYNREDQWRVPTEIYGAKPQLVQPYYLIMKLPTAAEAEFMLLYPFTPIRRNNLIAWLAARSDGENYGKRLLYQFPKQELVFGPEQIEALINQDPVISQQISLWNRQGSRTIQGNLLIIPIEQSLLYVEPLYLKAEETGVPILARVIVVYENRIVMTQTLEQALSAIFRPAQPATPAIIRPVEPIPAPPPP